MIGSLGDVQVMDSGLAKVLTNGGVADEPPAQPAAERVVRDCLAICEKSQPDDWMTFNTRSLLGGSLLGQKKYVEAEPLILSDYEGTKAR